MGPQRSAWALVLALAGASCADTARQAHFGWGPTELDAEQRCQQGATAACGELGRFLVARSDIEKDVERGLVLLEVACGQDDPPACAALGRMYIDRGHDKARARARELLTRACARRSAEACTGLGEVLEIDRGERVELVAAFHKGCALGDALGCERYGHILWRDTFGDGRTQAEEAFARACGLGRLSSCHLLAMVFAGDPARRAGGMDLLRRNCERGYARSCSTAAAAFAPLLSARADCRLAKPLAQKGCDGKEDDACAIADACALTGPARAATLHGLRLACERGVATSCLYWADAQTPEARNERVEKAYEIACHGDSPAAEVACPRLAIIALGRAQLSIDADRPLARLREACDHASGEACCGLADEYARGKWLPTDSTRASELREKACNLGQERCCQPPSSPAPPAP
jgi:TPR repeat protein